MSDFIHSREHFSQGDVAVLNCDTQCNFLLLDDHNFNNFKSGRDYRYFGGFYKMFPAKIQAPQSGYWNMVVNLGGGSANIRYGLSVIRR